MRYTNPVIPGFHPDPSICRVGEDYYLVTSSFEYFPGVPIFHSKDLVHWRQLGHCLTTEKQLPLSGAWSSGGIYAPTLRYHDGWFYMVTTNVSGGGNFYVKAQNPEGPWSEPVQIAQGGIDPSLMFDDDGRVYVQSPTTGDEGDGIYQCEIDIETGNQLSGSRLIWKGTGGAHPEGPHLYKINAYYYLMIAEGGTEYGHMETIARSRHPYGPFEPCPNNPILTNRSTDNGIHATGHADLVEAHDGSWWAVCLGIRPVSYPMGHHLGREVCLAPVSWTSEGWPIIGNDTHIAPVMNAPQLPQVMWPEKPARDDFDDAQLDMIWTFLRNPAAGSWSLTERPGFLVLHGQAAALDDTGSPAFVGRRLSHFSCRMAVRLEFDPQYEGEEAGLVLYMDEKHHYELAVKFIGGRRKLVFRRTVGSMQMIELRDCPEGAVILQFQALPEKFAATVRTSQSGPDAVEMGWGETHLLSTEVAGGFVGVMAAMYAVSEATEPAPASFDWFDYEPGHK